MRAWHVLTDNRRVQIPPRWIFYDTETFEERVGEGRTAHRLRLGTAKYVWYDDEFIPLEANWCGFCDVKKFWDWVESKFGEKSTIYLCAHNQSFDFAVVDGFDELVRRGWKMSTPIIDSNIFVVSFRKEKKRLKVIDSTNFFKFSLKKLGEWVGLPKMEVDFQKASDGELLYYCTRDVEILEKAMVTWLKFIKQNNLGNFRPTVSGQAFQAFRHRFMKYKIYIHAHKYALKLEREAYRGGRCECFRIGRIREKVYALDFNSLYPSTMEKGIYPTKLVTYIRLGSIDGLMRAMEEFLVIARVRIKIEEPAIAVKQKRLVFPVGEFDVTLTTPEIIWVLENGRLLKVYDYAVYESAPIFRQWVESLYPMRKGFKAQGDVVNAELTKLLMNSLYGKFGQRQEVTEVVGDAPPGESGVINCIDHKTHEVFRLVTFGGRVFKRKKGKDESCDSFPAVAAFVTAYGRMKLWEAMKTAGLENVYYCDTDSLFVNELGKEKLKGLLSPTELGMLKVQGEGDDLVIFCPKDYIFAGKTKLKGISKGAKQVGENTFAQPRWLKFRTLLRMKSLDAPVVEETIKKMRRSYDKGVVQPDGRVKPFSLS